MPDGVNIPGGPSFIGLPQPPDVPCDPTGDGWRGPPGPPGPDGTGVFLPLAGGTMTGALLLRGDPAASLEAASKHYVDQQTAVGTPPGGPFLPLIGGTMTGNLTIQKTTSYTGNTASLSDAALNIAQTSSGNITGTGEVDHNSLVITDTLSVNPPANTIASFQAQIDGTTLSLASLVSPPAAVPFTGSILANALTITGAGPGLAPGSTVQWAGGTDMVKIAAGPGVWTLYNTWGTVPSQAMTALASTFSVMGSISGNTLSSTSAFGPGVLTAGMQVRWNLPTPGSATIITGPVGGPWSLVRSSGDSSTIPLQPMLLLGPQPSQTLTWDTSDPDNPGSVTMGGYVTTPAPSHPAKFNLLADQGTVSLRPMQTIKAGPQRNVFGFSSYLNFGGGDGSRYGWRFNISQTAAMAGHGYYLPVYIVNRLRYPSGGTDLWSGAKGTGWAGNTVMSFEKAGTSAVGDQGPVNFRGGSSWEFDYQCLAGSPDDPAWPKATTAILGGIAVIRGGQSTWEVPIWEADYAIGIQQGGPTVRDLSNNLVLPKAAKYGIRFNGLSGISALDPLHGRAMAAVYPPNAFANDGSAGLYPNVAPFGVDWLSIDYTRNPFRWRGGAVLGSATPLPGALGIGGGYLSATNTTVSLDTAGSVCTGATVAAGQGGAGLYAGMVCQDDVSGTQVVITGVDGAISPRYGAATTVSLIPRTGQSHNAEIPTNPVQFRPMGNPITFLAPGPTGPKLNLTWTAPTTLALQPGGGATTFGGPVRYTATGGTTPRTAQDRAADVVNVLDYGAVGDGVTIDSAAIQAAATAIPSGGGVLWFPPGRTYLVDRTTFLKSNTTVCGEGPASLIRAIEGTWMNPPYTPTNTTGAVLQNAIFMNVNWDVMVAVDQNIQIINMGFHSAEPTATTRKAPVSFRMAQKVSTRGCHFYGGGNGPTHLACTDVEVSGNRIINFHSGGIEFWENCSGARVTNNYLVKAAVSSDPCIEFTSTTSSNGPGHSYKLLCANNIVLGGATGVFAIGVTDTDTVAKTSTVEDIIISDNVVDLAGNYGGGGAVTGAQGIGCYGGGGNYLITNNLIQNIVDGRALYVAANGHNTPRSVTISGNRAKNCTSVTIPSGALVTIGADLSSVMDNELLDCTCVTPYVIVGNSNILRLGVLSPPGSSGTNPRYSVTGTGGIIIDPDLTLGRITHGNEVMSSVGFRVGSGSLLANYIENGTWTPSLQFGGVTTGITYSVQAGVYQRVGKMIYVSCEITLTSKGAAAGNAQITGLPFSQVSPTTTRLVVSSALNFVTITTEPCVRISSNVITLVTVGITSGVNLTDANFANNSLLAFNGWFLTA
jgi:Pectate lyase superfamily protein